MIVFYFHFLLFTDSIAFEYLLSLGPAAADIAWRSLPELEEFINSSKDNDKIKAEPVIKAKSTRNTREEEILKIAAEQALRRACKCLEYALDSKMHFQFVQAHLQHFLRVFCYCFIIFSYLEIR